MLPILAFARRWWPVAAVLAALVGVWAWGNGREADGVRKERAAWEQEAARLRAVAAQEAQRRQAAVDAADRDAARSAAILAALAGRSRDDVRRYYANRPDDNRLCLSADRVRAIAAHDAAVSAAGTARAGADPVQGAGADGRD